MRTVRDVNIREERSEDLAAVREVHTEAFGDSAVADLVDGLRSGIAPPDRFALVAEESDEVVGHVMFTRAYLDAPRRLVTVRVLSPLGVRPSWQRRGVGSALVRRGLEAMTSVPLVFLEGSPTYYRRLGFEAGDTYAFRKPSLRIPDAAFQVFRNPSYEPWMTGTLVYSEIFWQFDSVGLRDA